MSPKRLVSLSMAWIVLLSPPWAWAGGQGQDATPAPPISPAVLEGKADAPDFPSGSEWLNIDRPLSFTHLKGKVVLLDFWTYCCINCMHVIPDLKKLEAKYPRELVVIGVHSAKFTTEKGAENIREAILRYEIEHPVINDRDFRVWRAFGVQAWPTVFLINPRGKVVGFASGEGVFERFDPLIAELVRHFDDQGQIDRKPVRFVLEKSRRPATLLAYPGKICADDKSGRLFFTDSNHHRVLVASLEGDIQQIIGTAQAGLQDGAFENARFFRPQGICFDPATELLYVADTENHAIRRINLRKKQVDTLAGTGRQADHFHVGGPGTKVALNSPWDLLLLEGRLFIAMAGFHQIWALDLDSGEARVHAGTGREAIIDGPLNASALAQPSGIATDSKHLYFADSEVSAVRQASPNPAGELKTLIGTGLFDFGDVDGRYPSARLQHPLGVEYHQGFLYIADTYNNKIKRYNPQTGELETFIGTGAAGIKDGPARSAMLNEPNDLCFAGGKMFIADSNNHLIRVCDLKALTVSTLGLRGLDRELKITD